ncbi:MAG: hypothetical protein C4303_00215 [candidate division GAL15 bacterium]
MRTLVRVWTVGEAVAVVERTGYRHTANVGIQVGGAALMTFFSCAGWEESVLGDLHGQERGAMEFYTEKKVAVEAWPESWARR